MDESTEINWELTAEYDLINQLHRSSNKSSIHIYPKPNRRDHKGRLRVAGEWPSSDAFKQLEKYKWEKKRDPGSANVARLVLSIQLPEGGTTWEWICMCVYVIWFTHLWPKNSRMSSTLILTTCNKRELVFPLSISFKCCL